MLNYKFSEKVLEKGFLEEVALILGFKDENIHIIKVSKH